jgi:hypothetical protein
MDAVRRLWHAAGAAQYEAPGGAVLRQLLGPASVQAGSNMVFELAYANLAGYARATLDGSGTRRRRPGELAGGLEFQTWDEFERELARERNLKARFDAPLKNATQGPAPPRQRVAG